MFGSLHKIYFKFLTVNVFCCVFFQIFKMRISDPACNDNEPPCYLEPDLEHPLFMEAVDQALALCSEEGGPPHVKLVLEWSVEAKRTVIADDSDLVEEHSSVKQLRAQALQGNQGMIIVNTKLSVLLCKKIIIFV